MFDGGCDGPGGGGDDAPGDSGHDGASGSSGVAEGPSGGHDGGSDGGCDGGGGADPPASRRAGSGCHQLSGDQDPPYPSPDPAPILTRVGRRPGCLEQNPGARAAPARNDGLMATVIPVGDTIVTRVLYADAAIDPGATGLTVDEVHSVPWREPLWAEGDQVRAAACAWVVRNDAGTIVIDPAGNVDEILHDPDTTKQHQDGFRAAFDRAGIDIDAVDAVVLSHVESVGITAVRDDGHGWKPFFPKSRIRMSDRALAAFDRASAGDFVFDAFDTLIDNDLVDTFADGDDILPGLRAEWTGAHNPGHTAFHVGVADAPSLTFVGHLAVTPLHLATGPCPAQNAEPERAWEWLTDVAQTGRWLAGPLWPSPGALRWDGATFVPWSPTTPSGQR
jgi:hypothetical protein